MLTGMKIKEMFSSVYEHNNLNQNLIDEKNFVNIIAVLFKDVVEKDFENACAKLRSAYQCTKSKVA